MRIALGGQKVAEKRSCGQNERGLRHCPTLPTSSLTVLLPHHGASCAHKQPITAHRLNLTNRFSCVRLPQSSLFPKVARSVAFCGFDVFSEQNGPTIHKTMALQHRPCFQEAPRATHSPCIIINLGASLLLEKGRTHPRAGTPKTSGLRRS